MEEDDEVAQKFVAAGLRAKALRKELALTWLASTEIILTMRALREAIPLPKSSALPSDIQSRLTSEKNAKNS